MYSNYDLVCKWIWIKVACLALLFSGMATAAPSIQQLSGALDHKNTITLMGSGFGSKSNPVPAVWDDASTGSIPTDNGKWDIAWPNPSDSPTYQIRYTTPINGISLPHNHITRYIAGGHGDEGWTLQVVMAKARNYVTYPYLYASWYSRAADDWVFDGSDSDNYKTFSHSQGVATYSTDGYWYTGLNPLHSNYDIPKWGVWDEKKDGTNPMAGKWVKTEIEMKVSQGSDGFFRMWDNGVMVGNYSGITDGPNAIPGFTTGTWSGTTRSAVIGGFGRPYGIKNNWRYFADVYLDWSLSRVILANNADLTKATIREPQIPSSWNNNSINVSVNLGAFSGGETAYLFVVDSSGQHNATGYPVVVGGSSSQSFAPPNPPAGIN